MSYTTKVYKDKGGDRQVVDADGELLIKGKLSIADGATINDGGDVYTVVAPDDVSIEIDDTSGELQIKSQGAIDDLELTANQTFDSEELDAVAAKVDELLAALRLAKIIAGDD